MAPLLAPWGPLLSVGEGGSGEQVMVSGISIAVLLRWGGLVGEGGMGGMGGIREGGADMVGEGDGLTGVG